LKKIEPNEDPAPLATKILELRVEKGYKQKEVPGVSPSSMQNIERQGCIPAKNLLGKLAKALDDGEPDLLKRLIELADLQKERRARLHESQKANSSLPCENLPSHTKTKPIVSAKNASEDAGYLSQRLDATTNTEPPLEVERAHHLLTQPHVKARGIRPLSDYLRELSWEDIMGYLVGVNEHPKYLEELLEPSCLLVLAEKLADLKGNQIITFYIDLFAKVSDQIRHRVTQVCDANPTWRQSLIKNRFEQEDCLYELASKFGLYKKYWPPRLVSGLDLETEELISSEIKSTLKSVGNPPVFLIQSFKDLGLKNAANALIKASINEYESFAMALENPDDPDHIKNILDFWDLLIKVEPSWILGSKEAIRIKKYLIRKKVLRPNGKPNR
jgi:transcriptional regulator with XRE-family HTH domain